MFFENEKDAAIELYSHLVLNVKGCKLRIVDGAYRIDDIPHGAVVEVNPGIDTNIPVKLRTAETITADDFYTVITVTDQEFVFKDGSFSNTAEVYGRHNETNRGKFYVNSSMDGWATLTCSPQGTPLNLFINSRVGWRRQGDGVPAGAGNIRGILVNASQPRYGNCLGRWQLRPQQRSDLRFEKAAPSSFKTIAEWNWSDGGQSFSTTSGKLKNAAGAKILADMGSGELSTDLPGQVLRGPEPNNREVTAETKGYMETGAMSLQAASCDWWDWQEGGQPRGVSIEVSTKDISASSVIFAFSFAGGFRNAATSYAFPVYWKVEYSADGGPFVRVGDEYELHSLPWYWENNIEGVKYPMSLRAGMGYTEHILNLPADAVCGHSSLVIRLSPARRNISTLALDDYTRGAARPENKTRCFVNFGAFAIRYR